MSTPFDQHWPYSTLDRHMMEVAVLKFIRTHRHGERQLLEWMLSVPSNMTEEEFDAERRRAAEEIEAARQSNLDRFNRARMASGKRPLNRRLEVDLARNRNQSAKADADREAVRRTLNAHTRDLTAKEVLNLLKWPVTKLRAVRRHMAELRKGRRE